MTGDRRHPDLGALLEQVVDPEIPVLTIADLGVLRGAAWDGDTARVTITPTYSGCPAMDLIRSEIVRVLGEAGIDRVDVETTYAPAWTTDWITEDGRRKLAEVGIAPPRPASATPTGPLLCPRCRSADTKVVSAFGSTACKALMVCERCGEPFDHFKEL